MSIRKLLYLSFEDLSIKAHIGVRKKIDYQIDGFQQIEIECDQYYMSDDGFYLNDKRIAPKKKFKSKLTQINHHYRQTFLIAAKHINFSTYDFVYLRYYKTNPYFISLLRTIKKQAPHLKMIAEVPTLIERSENLAISQRIVHNIDRIYNKQLHKFINLMVSYTPAHNLFGIKTVVIGNGIASSNFPMHQPTNKDNELAFITTANVSYWHGYDRLIKSMSNHYKNQPALKIRFNIVGEGEGISYLKELTSSLGLEDYVIFHGFKSGDELNEVFNHSQIGVSGIGAFRKKLTFGSSLKSREYCARGIPFILTIEDPDFNESHEFVHWLPHNESLFEFDSILKFYQRVTANDEYKRTMRTYANNYLEWKKKLAFVLDQVSN